LPATGLSEPEVAASVEAEELARVALPARRGRSDVALANVLGTVVHFIAFNAGVIALIWPLPIDAATRHLHLPAAAVATLALCALLATRGGLGRVDGCILLTLYAAYLALALQSTANRIRARTAKQAKTVAIDCHGLPFGSHGKQGVCRGLPPVAGGPLPAKEGVDGSSPAEGFSVLLLSPRSVAHVGGGGLGRRPRSLHRSPPLHSAALRSRETAREPGEMPGEASRPDAERH